MTDRKRKLALIHVAQKQLALTDEQYRALLFGAAGIQSAGELKTEVQFRYIMKAFENAGFKNTSGRRKMTDRKLAKCYAIWCELHKMGVVKSKEYAFMMKWIAGRTGGTDERFLREVQKSKMIEELKSWRARVEGTDDRNG